MNDVPAASSADPDSTQAYPPAGATGAAIGPYRLLERLGEGGMGEVWLAEQSRPIRRQVAVKVIKPGMDTAQVIARFEGERQALALMDHPTIAKVFDGGATPHGRPYFAMECVRGESLTAYCDRVRLPLRKRLELFIRVCEGVHHAHQKGIIHRDLKPNNILITLRDDQPLPKIIDFGIAKAMAQPLTERTLYTALGGFVGTLEYASPEQADPGSADVDTRTDVYALGVVLYELLTGTLPFDPQIFKDRGLEEIRRTIRDSIPPRPSTRITQLGQHSRDIGEKRRTEPSRLASLLRGELDWIVMKAIEKDRTRRYGSASDLAADVVRHLANQPVLAGPPSTTYRVRKFVQRHRFGVAAAAVLAVVLVAFAGAMAMQAQRIARERDRANSEAEVAKQVADFLVGLFKVSDPSEARGNTLTAREILDNGAQRIGQTLAAQPQVQARLQATIGAVYTNLGIYESAEPLVQRAVDTYRRLNGADSRDTLSAAHALANLYWYQGRLSEAEALYRELVETRTRLLGSEHPETLKATFDLASTYFVQKQFQKSEDLNRRTGDIQRRILGKEHPDTIATFDNLAVILLRQKRYHEAAAASAELLEIKNRVFGETHPDTLRNLHQLGVTYVGLKRFTEAERLLTLARNRKARVMGERHPSTILTIWSLAKMYTIQRRYQDAEAQLLSAAQLLPIDAASPKVRRPFYAEGVEINIPKQMADLYQAWGKPAKAAEWSAQLPK